MSNSGSARVPPRTPDGRYMVVRGRLWRLADPSLPEENKQEFVHALMDARRAVRAAKGDPYETAFARAKVDEAKRALGERGDVWWMDGAPDYNRQMARDTPYAQWYAAVTEADTKPP